MYDTNTLNLCIMRSLWFIGLAVQKDLACIGLINASKKLDEG